MISFLKPLPLLHCLLISYFSLPLATTVFIAMLPESITNVCFLQFLQSIDSLTQHILHSANTILPTPFLPMFILCIPFLTFGPVESFSMLHPFYSLGSPDSLAHFLLPHLCVNLLCRFLMPLSLSENVLSRANLNFVFLLIFTWISLLPWWHQES